MKASIHGNNTLPVRVMSAVVPVLAALWLTGCRTYYGHDDICEVVKTRRPDAPRDIRHYAVVTARNGVVSLKCFTLYNSPAHMTYEKRIVGRKEWYRDYDGQFAAPFCVTGESIPGAWFWGRCFGGIGTRWYLAEYDPSVLRMISYLPFISLFMLQTPPYLTFGAEYGEEIRYAAADQRIVDRTRTLELQPMQKLCPRHPVEARVFCGGRSCGEREFLTDEQGEVALTEFLRKCVKAAPLGRRDFLLTLRLRDDSGRVLLSRDVAFTSDHVMPRAAANDLAAYRSGDTDCLNRLLLSRRSHLEWRQEVFADDFAVPADDPAVR